jgi:hypothetical protein
VVVDALELPSGLMVADPLDRLHRFCQAEYGYYDGIPQGDPNRLEPVRRARHYRRERVCDRLGRSHPTGPSEPPRAGEPLLAQVPTNVDLVSADEAALAGFAGC